MYLDRSQVQLRGKTYTRILLRQSYRHEGKVKHRTLANLSKASAQELKAIELALKHKHALGKLTAEVTSAATPGRGDHPPASAPVMLRQGLSIGAVAVLEGLARELGLTRALGRAGWRCGKGSPGPSIRVRGSARCAWPPIMPLAICWAWRPLMRTISMPTWPG